ncbi:ATPase, PilT family [Archaeoglobus sulfaticallidus PM70-1]|uniref:ATPase, PilT family n=1 Tax=Archaeoglobus sulfaticallidus PM70-1 TaxID=387631 RepID=N0BDF0_9EURY|nr:PINc/VapC family ATPase [Archaeoglobus sulfaticallidus]AGK61013.1 ATPase, PilT family [Archaeoglobus sulfaticallidus PM70-1]
MSGVDLSNKSKIVLDTSALIDGRISKIIEKSFDGKVIIPEPAVAELEAQANFGKMSGFRGLEEITRIRKIAEKKGLDVVFSGERPGLDDIKLSKGGAIDEMIRRVAEVENATLITCDRVQHIVSVAKGIDSIYLAQERIEPEKTKIMSFFTEDTASVHLKEGVPPYAKRGRVGSLKLVKLSETPMTAEELRGIANEILESARQDDDSSIEIERHGAVVVQLRDLRIAIAEKPFSDKMEITAVRPVAKVSIHEYGVDEELKRRFIEKQRGILIAGPPGAGKSTFAASVADFLMEHGFLVKTMESPRDLMVRDEVTQYSPLEGDMSLTADILLLVRPDYTIYDELRKTSDFQIFADMRLAGVGMIGVTHATRAIDAVQRMVGRVELGVIPQVVDTVIFIDAGRIAKVYELKFNVKVPTGMTEADLARPVIDVIDFKSKRVEYEIYTYGEQVVVMPLVGERDPEEIKQRLEEILFELVTDFEVDVLNDRKAIIRVPEDQISFILGRRGRNIKRIEDEVKISIDVQPLRSKRRGEVIEAEVGESRKQWLIYAPGLEGKEVDIFAENDYLTTASVGRKGVIRIRKDKDIGKAIKIALMRGKKIYIKY